MLDWFFFFSFQKATLNFRKKRHMVRHFNEKLCEKMEAKLKKLICLFCCTEDNSDCYRTAEHMMSAGCWKKIRANWRSGLNWKLLSPTRKNYDFVQDSYEGCQSPFRANPNKAKLICEDEIGICEDDLRDVGSLSKIQTHRSMLFFDFVFKLF